MTPDSAFGIDDEEDPAWDADPNPEMVRWQPSHRPDAAIRTHGAQLSPAGALGVIALGSTVVGALAIGALAIGALAIGRLAIGRASFRRLEIDELVVGRLYIKD